MTNKEIKKLNINTCVEQLAPNLIMVRIGEGKFYYSYETLIAFSFEGEFHIVINEWTRTTGKHLSLINPNTSIREDAQTFEDNYNRLIQA